MTTGANRDEEQVAVGDRNAVRDAVSPRLGVHIHLVAVALVCAFGMLAGLAGALGGLSVVAVWYAFGAPYAVGIGHVVVVLLFPNGIVPLSFVVLEGVFVLIILASPPRTATRNRLHYSVAVLATIGLLGGVVWFLLREVAQPIWIAGIVLLATTGSLLYGLHRYELVFVLERLERERTDLASSDSNTGEPTALTSTSASSRQRSESATHDNERS